LDQQSQVEMISGQKLTQIIHAKVQFDTEKPFWHQINNVVSKIPLSFEEYQTQPILIIPPSLNTIALVLMAELHGRMGYFPPVLRMKLVKECKLSFTPLDTH